MEKVYLLVRKVENKVVETNEKVYLSKQWAERVAQDWNEINIVSGVWEVLELEVDDFRTAEEERLEQE